eukprot:gene990-4233_t
MSVTTRNTTSHTNSFMKKPNDPKDPGYLTSSALSIRKSDRDITSQLAAASTTTTTTTTTIAATTATALFGSQQQPYIHTARAPAATVGCSLALAPYNNNNYTSTQHQHHQQHQQHQQKQK